VRWCPSRRPRGCSRRSSRWRWSYYDVRWCPSRRPRRGSRWSSGWCGGSCWRRTWECHSQGVRRASIEARAGIDPDVVLAWKAIVQLNVEGRPLVVANLRPHRLVGRVEQLKLHLAAGVPRQINSDATRHGWFEAEVVVGIIRVSIIVLVAAQGSVGVLPVIVGFLFPWICDTGR